VGFAGVRTQQCEKDATQSTARKGNTSAMTSGQPHSNIANVPDCGSRIEKEEVSLRIKKPRDAVKKHFSSFH
jgi:hypothetical protein